MVILESGFLSLFSKTRATNVRKHIKRLETIVKLSTSANARLIIHIIGRMHAHRLFYYELQRASPRK